MAVELKKYKPRPKLQLTGVKVAFYTIYLTFLKFSRNSVFLDIYYSINQAKTKQATTASCPLHQPSKSFIIP